MDKYNRFVDKLIYDISRSKYNYKNNYLETIYFGGGTPSVLKGADLQKIISAVNSSFDMTKVKEITFECNPDDMTLEYCQMLKESGINRLSIGIQSFFDSHLKAMNRRHDSKCAENAVRLAQSSGFNNISIDLIYGLPFMTEKQWQYNLEKAVGLNVQHISSYHLTIEKGTVFDRKKLSPVDEKISETHYRMLLETLQKNGFKQYEISNFAKTGFKSIHNSGYWADIPYLGLGPSSHSFDGCRKRWWEPSNMDKWLEGVPAECEYLTDEERKEEIIMTSLRTTKGLKTSDGELIKKADIFIAKEIMVYSNGYLRIRPEYFLISDYIISQLI